jgi:hypothetical protein
MSNIESQRTAMADQPAADDYPTLEQRHPTAEPLFITCMFMSESNPTAPRRTPL